MDFWDQPVLGKKKFQKLRGFGSTMKKKINEQTNFGTTKNEK